jgi:protein gp37
MGDKTGIQWADHTFNPWVGCTKISAACDHCYAEGWARRSGSPELWQGERRRTSAANWGTPMKWDRAAAAQSRRARVFCASLADFFDNQVPTRWRDDTWHRIDQTPNLDWLLLTKRPENILKMLPTPAIGAPQWAEGWHNVWIGTTVENRATLRRLDILRRIPAAVHFLSIEPLLEDLGEVDLDGISWVICGGESGPGARPMHPAWARSLRDQCKAAGVTFFFKQWGEWHPCQWSEDGPWYPMPGASFDSWKAPVFDHEDHDGWNWRRVGKARAGRLLDGVEHSEFPEMK